MNKKFIIKNSFEFNEIINAKCFVKDRAFVVYYCQNQLGYSRYGISVGAKLGKAHLRNHLKRQIRNILQTHKMGYQNSLDYIIIIRKNGTNCSYQELEKSLLSLLAKIKGEKNAKKA